MMMPADHRYAAHEALVRPARMQSGLWRLLAGLVIVAAFSLGGTVVAYGVIGGVFPGPWVQGLSDGSNPAAMLVLLGGFGFAILGVAAAVRLLHQRSLLTVTGNMVPLVRQFRKVLMALLALGAVVAVLPPYDMGEPLVANVPLWQWLAFLPLSLLAVLVQVSAEEILFRGYLQQALAARFRHPAVWLCLPSVVFALGHYLPAEAGSNAGLVALWAALFGILMADLTARAGSLGPAIAVHFVNNAVALLFVASPTSLNGLALYLLPYEMSDTAGLRPWLAVDVALMLVSWLTARLALRR